MIRPLAKVSDDTRPSVGVSCLGDSRLRVKVGRFGALQNRGRDCESRVVWRGLVLALTLLAFAVQSFITQTHIHLPSAFETPGGIAVSAGKAGPSASDPRGIGSTDDPATCPFCQEIVYAGQYLSPAAIGVVPPTIAIAIIPIAAYAHVERLISSHTWQGRAPPSL
jgi:hypothetical protein